MISTPAFASQLYNHDTLFWTGIKTLLIPLDSRSIFFFFILPDLPASAKYPASIYPPIPHTDFKQLPKQSESSDSFDHLHFIYVLFYG